MDCCDSKSRSRKPKSESTNEGNIRTKKTFMWVVIGILVIAAIFMTVKAANIGTTGTGQITSGSGSVDTSGWTENEVMNYEMHGIVPARISGSASAGSSSSQVGSC